ncbi:MAG: hypothetical protein ACI4M8_00620 [Christensenellales bacterium]
MKAASDELVRLRRVILGDSLKIPNGVLEVLKNDVKGVLNSYFDLKEDSLQSEITVDENGVYHVVITASCTSVKKVKAL